LVKRFFIGAVSWPKAGNATAIDSSSAKETIFEILFPTDMLELLARVRKETFGAGLLEREYSRMGYVH
jgi:hypothetical protein